jgi:hypothetical protein
LAGAQFNDGLTFLRTLFSINNTCDTHYTHLGDKVYDDVSILQPSSTNTRQERISIAIMAILSLSPPPPLINTSDSGGDIYGLALAHSFRRLCFVNQSTHLDVQFMEKGEICRLARAVACSIVR